MHSDDHKSPIDDSAWDFDLNDELSILAYAKKLHALRDAALKTPLRTGHHFNVCLDRHHIERERPLLSFSRKYDPCKLVLRVPVQTEADHWSQVWIASVQGHARCDLPSAGDLAQERVVVKIIQPSMLCIPEPHRSRYYLPPRQAAVNEDLIYRQLTSLQGTAVPYYYGMHQVNRLLVGNLLGLAEILRRS